MPMNKVAMGTAMINAVDAYIAGVADPKGDNLVRQEIFEAIADAIIKHIQSNALVSTTVPALGLVAPVGGGPVTGAASGTGTVA